jgi:ATP-binding cassette subfamily C protein CydC
VSGSLATLLATQRRRHRRTWRQAGMCAALAAVASVALLGVSGWFLASAAAAGGAGLAAATAFNYLLPSACIRLLAILRTGARHGERLLGHASALRSMAHLRPMLFDALCAARGRRAPAASSTTTVTTGEATTALMQDLRTIEDHLIRGTAVRGALAALACGAALVALAGWPALLVLAMAALLIAASIRHLSRRACAQDSSP